jgi:hemerythrin
LDNLAIINKVIEEHQIIRGHIKLVGDSTSDQEAIASLTRARADWIPGRPEILAEKQKRLQQALSFLDEGLKNHFAFEERVLPPLLGDLFVRAITLDHREIIKEIDEAKSLVSDIKLEGLSRDELLSKESHIQQVINRISDLVEDHAIEEEVVLGMAERALRGR